MQAIQIIRAGLGIYIVISSIKANKNFIMQSNKFSTSINKCHPSRKLEEEKSKFSISTPSDPDIDPARLISP